MIIYEVNLHVQRGIADRYRRWLEGHVRQMLEFEGFMRADIAVDVAAEDSPTVSYVVWYRVASQEHLDAYLREHAERMRGDGLHHFGNQFTADRRILSVIDERTV